MKSTQDVNALVIAVRREAQMLVLSRKIDQKVVLPGLDVTIQVVRCRASGVTLGIEAPPQIRILREELQSQNSASSETFDSEVFRELLEQRVQSLPEQVRHDWRDRLNTLTMALHMLNDQIDAGEFTDAGKAYDELIKLLTESSNRNRGQRDEAPRDEAPRSEATVLLVEDQDNEREMLAGILRMHGYSVATAHDGLSALEYLENNEPPEFVLVDMQMPGCDGAEVVRQIRESERLSRLSIYVVSGQQEENYEIASDVDHWFMKPVDPRRLLNSMSDVGARNGTFAAI